MMELGNTNDIFANPLHPYTQALFSAVPIPDPDVKMNRIILKGDIPSPANPPAGCKFHTRCAKCMAVCKHLAPRFKAVAPDHFVACHLYDEEMLAQNSKYEELEKADIKISESIEEKKSEMISTSDYKKRKHTKKSAKKKEDFVLGE